MPHFTSVHRLLLQIGYFYQKLVEHVSMVNPAGDATDLLSPETGPSTPHGDLEDVERVPLLRKTAAAVDPNKAFAEMEMYLQISLIKVRKCNCRRLACSMGPDSLILAE